MATLISSESWLTAPSVTDRDSVASRARPTALLPGRRASRHPRRKPMFPGKKVYPKHP